MTLVLYYKVVVHLYYVTKNFQHYRIILPIRITVYFYIL